MGMSRGTKPLPAANTFTMANWNYRKRISAGSGQWINLSKSGASTSVGGKGFTVNFGKKGTHLTTGIPGTGIYKREKIGGASGTDAASSIGFLFLALVMAGIGYLFRKADVVSYCCYGLAALSLVCGLIALAVRIRKSRIPRAPRIMDYYPNAWIGGTQQSDVDAEFQKYLRGENPTFCQPAVLRTVAEYSLPSGVVNPNAVANHFQYSFATAFLIIAELQSLGICGPIPDSSNPALLVHSEEEIVERIKG